MKLPIIPSRRTNKILCLFLLAMTFSFLLIGGVYSLLGDSDMGFLLCVPAAISACFSLLYGVLWFFYGRKEKKRQQKLEHVAQLLAETDDHSFVYHNFCLPKEELIRASKHRFQKITYALLISSIVVFAVLYGILYFVNGYNGIGHLILVFVFCLLMVIPGIIIQYAVFWKYARSVPETILLFPGKLIVDDLQYHYHDIDKITISSNRRVSRDTSVLYRKLIVKTKDRVNEYTIDYRFADAETPHWKEYAYFLASMRSWAEQNRVKLIVDYMN